MEPALLDQDIAFVRRKVKNLPKVGQLVVLSNPKDESILIKRVSSLGKNTFAVKSDNPVGAVDSRSIGSLLLEDLIGIVTLVYRS